VSETTPKAAPDPWAAYVPNETSPWNLRRVFHLHLRAGFAATWRELQRDLRSGPEASINRLLTGEARAEGVPADFERTATRLGEMATDVARLQAWWVYRMLFGPDPLGERLTLLWHDHFATSNAKVNDVRAMRRQNETFRKHVRAPFGEMLNAAVREPALLLYLDAPDNRKEHPNENLARELMELFTLGLGHYTEADVKEAARALTGWTVPGSYVNGAGTYSSGLAAGSGSFREVPALHDAGAKLILGRTGRWTGSDLVKMLLEHPAIAERLAWRVCGLLMGEGTVDAVARRALAEGLRQHELDVAWAVGKVLRSQRFFAEANLGTRVRAPVEHLVGTARALEAFDDPPSTLALADWAARLGQDLFHPPNVGGWPGGRAWLSTRAVIARASYGIALLGRELFPNGKPLDLPALARRHRQAGSLDEILTFYSELLLGSCPDAIWRERLIQSLSPGTIPDAQAVRRAVALILASPEAQLG
jgi:uncharacterized protein (DUF1800 family)